MIPFLAGFLTSAEWSILWLSVRVALVAVLLVGPLAFMVASFLSHRRTPFAFVLENTTYLPLVLPPVVTGYALLWLLSPNQPAGAFLRSFFGVDIPFTFLGAALAAGIVAFPLLMQSIRIALEQVDPEWKEAGLVFGGSRWDVFRTVTLPLSAPGILAGFTMAFARALGEFGATIVLAGNIPGRTQTIPLAIFTRLNQLQGEAGALRLVICAVAISSISLLIYTVLMRRLDVHS